MSDKKNGASVVKNGKKKDENGKFGVLDEILSEFVVET